MSLSLTIVAPEGLPEANEPIVSMSASKQGLRGAMFILKYNSLEDSVDLAFDLLDLIKELDKGSSGVFNNAYFWDFFDSRSPDDRRFFYQVASMSNIPVEECFGDSCRRELRKDAFRFYLYVRAGYKIEWKQE